MNIDTLPDDGLHRVANAVEGMDAPIPTMLIAVDIDSALRIADRLRRPLAPLSAHCRASSRTEPPPIRRRGTQGFRPGRRLARVAFPARCQGAFLSRLPSHSRRCSRELELGE